MNVGGTAGAVPAQGKPHSRKRPRDAPAHVISVPLRPKPAVAAKVVTRLEAGRKVYNASLGEALCRCEAMHADPGWEIAKKLPKGPPCSPAAMARKAAFTALAERHGFTRTKLQSYGSSLRSTWVRQHVGAQEAQLLAARAFDATDRWSRGLGGKPRFKSFRRGLRSAGTKDTCGDMAPVFDGQGAPAALRWAGLDFPFAPLPGGQRSRAHREGQAERERLRRALAEGGLLQARVVRTTIGGRPTLRAQFVVDGRAPVRHAVGGGKVSVDAGPSDIYVTAADTQGQPVPAGCTSYPLAPGAVFNAAGLRRAQRHFDRQHRAGSPSCFDEKGRHREGGCDWAARSKRAERTKAKISDGYRRLAERRSSEHGKLANGLLAVGTDVRYEDVNYVAWQKMFPRSARDRAVGAFMAGLARKAENAGGSAYAYSTRTTALSQTCTCGVREKKPLSQRYHRCTCGVEAQRDMFSSFLGQYVTHVEALEDKGCDVLDLGEAKRMFPVFAPYLQEAGELSGKSGTAAKHRVRRRRPPGRRSLVRIRNRHKRRAHGATEVLGKNSEPTHATVASTVIAEAA